MMSIPNKNAIHGIIYTAFFILFLNSNLYPKCLQEKKDETTLQHEVTVTLKLVQVYVTDKKGNPVLDLGKEDFVIYDNGKQKSITEFEKHILSIPSMEEKIQPRIVQESAVPAPRELMSRKFFLFFDFAYSSHRGILKAREAALHFIDNQLQPFDEIGVLSYSALKGLTLHEYLTTDHRKVREVVGSFGEEEVHGRAENFEAEYWREEMDINPLDASKRGGVFDKGDKRKEVLDSERKESRFQAHHFFPKMTDLAKSLRYIPGYKHIILFSSGVPYSLIYGISFTSQKKYGFIDLGDPNLRQGYEDMLKELSASNSAVYTLDTEELIAKLGVDSRVTGVPTLQRMSSSTGGKYFGNINSYEKHMQKIQNLTGCYYVLGYYIDEKWNGKYQKIKVKVNRPGCKVHAQKGYFNPKPFSEYTRFEKMLHLVDLALSEDPVFQTPIRFPMTALPCVVNGEPNFSLFSRINKEKIQELCSGEVEIVTIIFDKEDNIVKIEKERMDFSKLPKGNVYYSNLLSIDPGDYKCRVVIRNLETGRGAVASSVAKVTEVPDYSIKLFPPLLLKPEEEAFYLGELPAAYAFDTSQYSPLVEELDRGTEHVWAMVRCSFSGIQRPSITFSANLIHYEGIAGNAIPVTLSILKRHHEEEAEIFLIEIQTQKLRAGAHFLYLFAEDNLTHLSSSVNTAFKVK
jgi:VWFA-related protein